MTDNLETMEVQPPQVVEAPVIHESSFMPVLTIEEAQRRINTLKQFVRENLKKDVDFGSIPGTGDKPTLLKPGAEKLCTFFGLRSAFEIIEFTQDWDKGFFNYWYKCRLYRGDNCIAEGEGSANSYERKYRWRTVPLFKASDEEKARATREETRRSRDGRLYKMLVLENDDPYTLVNTLQKMAQKRALIAATLIAVNASEFFTQDIEDMVPSEAEGEPRLESAEEPVTRPERREGEPYFAGAEVEPTGHAAEGGRGRSAAEPTEQQPGLFHAEEQQEEVLLKFRERPGQDTLQTIKAAGFRWDPKKVTWHAPVNHERLMIAEELGKRGLLD